MATKMTVFSPAGKQIGERMLPPVANKQEMDSYSKHELKPWVAGLEKEHGLKHGEAVVVLKTI